jgi:hypothetical protein
MKELVQFFNFFLAILFFHAFTSAFRFFQSLFMYSSSCDYHHHLFFVFPVLPRNMPAIIHIKNTIFVIYNREFYWDPTRVGGDEFFSYRDSLSLLICYRCVTNSLKNYKKNVVALSFFPVFGLS